MTVAAPPRGDDSVSSPVESRSVLRAVGVPAEHGGWGLTGEPILLGLLLVPSLAGLFVGFVGGILFLLRTPVRFVLVDARRRRTLRRTVVARRLAVIEAVVAVLFVVSVFRLSSSPFWVPATVASPLVLLQMWFDVRSRSRRLVPELAGSIGISSLAASITIAGGARASLALGVWMILAARAVTSIPFVRQQVGLLHHRETSSWPLAVWDGVAVTLAAGAAVIDHSLLVAFVSVACVVLGQRLSVLWPTARAKVIGMRQMVFGMTVVVATVMGVVIQGGGR